MDPGIRIIPLPSANSLLGGRMSMQKSGQLHVLRIENYQRRMIYKLANGMNMWEQNGNTTTLLLSLKGLAILERRGQVNTIVMKVFNSILFKKSGHANMQYTYQSINQKVVDLYQCLRWINIKILTLVHDQYFENVIMSFLKIRLFTISEDTIM